MNKEEDFGYIGDGGTIYKGIEGVVLAKEGWGGLTGPGGTGVIENDPGF